MEFNRWIETVGNSPRPGKVSGKGVHVVAALLGESPRAVYSWYRQERIPSFSAGVNIILKSKGDVDWNGIYAPFARKLFKPGGDHAVS